MSTCTLETENVLSEDRGRSLVRGAEASQVPKSNDIQLTTKMPPTGLLHLKTRAENRAQTDTIQCWSIELPAKAANNALK